jgi:hypothetical protein
MGWERRILLDQETQASDAATRRIALPRTGLLSGLMVRIRITNGATAGEETIMEAIDRIEVVADGSNYLFSLEGTELFRWAQFILGRCPAQIRNEALSAVQELTLPVLFGRFLGDPEFSLDLSQYRDVELRIQYSPTIAVTGFATGTTQLHIPMWISDDVSPPGPRRGWLRTTQTYAFVSAASGETIVELARAYPYWDMMVYCREAGIADGVDITIAELRANDRRLIPFTGRWDDIQAQNEVDFLKDNGVQITALRANAAVINAFTGRILDARVKERFTYIAATDFPMFTIASVAGDQITLAGQLVEGSATYAAVALDTTRRTLDVTARGLGVGNAILLPFATLHGNPDFVLPAPSYSRLQLALTNGGADGAVRVSTRELVGA